MNFERDRGGKKLSGTRLQILKTNGGWMLQALCVACDDVCIETIDCKCMRSGATKKKQEINV